MATTPTLDPKEPTELSAPGGVHVAGEVTLDPKEPGELTLL